MAGMVDLIDALHLTQQQESRKNAIRNWTLSKHAWLKTKLNASNLVAPPSLEEPLQSKLGLQGEGLAVKDILSGTYEPPPMIDPITKSAYDA